MPTIFLFLCIFVVTQLGLHLVILTQQVTILFFNQLSVFRGFERIHVSILCFKCFD